MDTTIPVWAQVPTRQPPHQARSSWSPSPPCYGSHSKHYGHDPPSDVPLTKSENLTSFSHSVGASTLPLPFISFASQSALLRAFGAFELLLPGVRKSGMFRFFRRRSRMLCFFFQNLCQAIINHRVCRSQTILPIGKTHEYTVRRQICCLLRYCCRFWALHDVSGVPIGALLVVLQRWLFGCVCVSRVSGRLRLVEVFAVVTTWSVLLSVVSGRRILCRPLEHWGARRLFHRGIRLQAAAASCTHVSCSGGREPVAWVQMQLTGNRHFFGVYKRSARPC